MSVAYFPLEFYDPKNSKRMSTSFLSTIFGTKLLRDAFVELAISGAISGGISGCTFISIMTGRIIRATVRNSNLTVMFNDAAEK